jgi:hypothetical protein
MQTTRRWYQFRLRTLLIGVVLLGAISCGLARLATIMIHDPGSDVVVDALVKQTLSSILAKYGDPDSDQRDTIHWAQHLLRIYRQA